jgi:amino acid permease
MGTMATLFAVLKAYCSINILLLPRSFVNGGFVLSPIMLVVSCTLECTCAVLVSNIALQYGIYDYAALVEHAFGLTARKIVRTLLMLVHFQFLIGQVTFSIQSI